MTAYICLGKFGDLANALTMLCEIFKESGEKPTVIVSKQYAELAQDCPCVNVDIWDGSWTDLRGAMRYAKSQYRSVKNLSTFGDNFPIEQRLSGFQLDQYERGGCLNKFGTLPLILNGAKNVFDERGAILMALQSESSSFPRAAELEKLVSEAYPDKHIIKLSDIHADRISDFVGLYDQSACLITIDTIHAHLSAASKIPTFVFATDQPTLWHGTSYQPRFHFHCRYGDFERRKDEFLHQLRHVIHNMGRPKIIEIEGLKPGAYNPSIIEHEGKILMTSRWHKDETWISHPWMAELDDQFRVIRNTEIKLPETLNGMAVEDCRLFHFNGVLHMSYVAVKTNLRLFRSVVGYGSLQNVDGAWTLLDDIRPKIGRNDFSTLEKNWLMHDSGGKLFVFYGDGRVFEIEGDKMVKEHKSELLKWNYGIPHGGCLLPWKGKLLRFFHARTDDSEKPYYWHYRVGVAIHESTPPFTMTSINPNPILTGDEQWRHGKLWKRRVVFAMGAIERDGKVYLSYGHNDSQCRIIELKEKDLA